MTIHAGVSLPGPFFIAFPVGNIAAAIAWIAMSPFILVIWIGYMMIKGVIWATIKLTGAGIQAGLHANDLRIEAREPRLSADEQAFLDGIMNR